MTEWPSASALAVLTVGLGASALTATSVGDSLAVWRDAGTIDSYGGAPLVEISMVPRAEVAMIVMQRGHALGGWPVPPALFAGMVLVSLGTCLVTPPAIRYLSARGRKGARKGATS